MYVLAASTNSNASALSSHHSEAKKYQYHRSRSNVQKHLYAPVDHIREVIEEGRNINERVPRCRVNVKVKISTESKSLHRVSLFHINKRISTCNAVESIEQTDVVNHSSPKCL